MRASELGWGPNKALPGPNKARLSPAAQIPGLHSSHGNRGRERLHSPARRISTPTSPSPSAALPLPGTTVPSPPLLPLQAPGVEHCGVRVPKIPTCPPTGCKASGGNQDLLCALETEANPSPGQQARTVLVMPIRRWWKMVLTQESRAWRRAAPWRSTEIQALHWVLSHKGHAPWLEGMRWLALGEA